jgi:single-strand DNA-binding protein
MVNKVILIGNLGSDPELRATPSGQQVVTFSLATNRRWKDKNGDRREEVEWHSIVIWGRQAEIAAQYLVKGKQIYLEGRLKTSSWNDRETGDKKYRTQVICRDFQMLGRKEVENTSGEDEPYYDDSDGPELEDLDEDNL